MRKYIDKTSLTHMGGGVWAKPHVTLLLHKKAVSMLTSYDYCR